jgi:hemolysin D
VVQQLAIHTVGGVVTPAQPLMVIVPSSGPLEVEAWIENKDVGFVQAGLPAEIKVDTFPFTRYGTVAGEVLSVSADAVPQERAGLVYGARVSLDDTALRTEEGEIRLRPGMAVSVEIKTGERRLIEFVLSPLLKAWQESGRER